MYVCMHVGSGNAEFVNHVLKRTVRPGQLTEKGYCVSQQRLGGRSEQRAHIVSVHQNEFVES